MSMVEVEEMEESLAGLIELTGRRWAIPVIAALGEAGGAKFVTLARRLGVSAESLSRTLGALIEMDYALRNPGYGHPMRPEYLLTPWGEAVAPGCAEVEARVKRAGAEDVCAKKWALPALAAMELGAERFGEVRRALEGVTPRALSMALRELVEAGLIDRRIMSDQPVEVVYLLTQQGRSTAKAAVKLARACGY